MKKNLSKFLIGLGSLVTLAPVSLMAIKCQKEHPNHIPKGDRVANIIVKDEFKLTDEEKKNIDAHKIVVITDGGDIRDKSFNQSAWEGAETFGEQNNLPTDKYNILHVKNNQYEENYNAALTEGYKYWVLTGFLHEKQIIAFAKKHKEEIKKNNVVIIGIDFNQSANEDLKGHFIGLNFVTKEGGFMAGYATGKYLSGRKEAEKRKISALGGADFPGVTDFIEGYLKGALLWNTENATLKLGVSEEKINISTGFDPTVSTMTSAADASLTSKPAMLLTVAGPLTHVVSDNPKFKDNNVLVIGVDTDQAITASKNQDHYFTSILKRIGQATYETIGNLIKGNKIDGFELGKTSTNISKGVSADWVGLSPTYLPGDEKAKADEALKLAKEKFNALADEDKTWLLSAKAIKTGTDLGIVERLAKLVEEIKK